MNSTEWTLKSRDGLELYVRSWKPEKPKAVVMLVHGHAEHVKRYEHVAAAFTQAGYAMLGLDLRGHGQSEGQRGHTSDYECLMDDIGDFIADARQRYPGLPVFLYGHSMGGNLVLNHVLRSRRSDLRGLIATSPWLKLAFDPPAIQLFAARLLNRVLPSFSMASGLKPEDLCRDPLVVKAYVDDPLVHGKITARLVSSILESGLWALDHAAELTTPTLVTHGSADRITSTQASRDFAAKAGTNVTLRIWEGAYHETHNEPEKAAVIKTMIDWMDTRV